MKNNMLIIISTFSIIGRCLIAQERHKENPHFVWIMADDVAVEEDGIYADSKKGMFKLNVIEYDRVNNRYKVLCRCLEDPHLDSAEALSALDERIDQ